MSSTLCQLMKKTLVLFFSDSRQEREVLLSHTQQHLQKFAAKQGCTFTVTDLPCEHFYLQLFCTCSVINFTVLMGFWFVSCDISSYIFSQKN